MKVGDNVLIKGHVTQVHEDGSCFVTLGTGQSVYTDVRNCETVEAAETPAPDGLEKLKLSELVELCKEKGLTYAPNSTKASLIASLRA